jgi:C-terminal processing protease CtpA/Prc
MRPFRSSIAACAVAGWLSLPPVCAAQPAASAPQDPSSHEIGDEEDAILASPAWADLVGRLREQSSVPVDEPRLRTSCRFGLMLPRPAGWTATDICLYAAMRTLGTLAGYQTTAGRAAQRASQPVGIGLELALKNPGEPLTVLSPFHGASGERAGILPGDRIERIDGHDIVPLTAPQVFEVFKGAEGSVVQLDIARGSAPERLSISAKRERFTLPSLWQEALGPRLAAVRFARLDADTPAELARWVNRVLTTTKPLPGALVVDLRGNWFGQVEAMTRVAGAFSAEGTVVAYERGRSGEVALVSPPLPEYRPTMHDWLVHVRIAVLVDARTSSTAEALALFLREQRGARIFGVKTAGIENVGRFVPVAEAGTLQIPLGQLRSSKRASWEGQGVVPDDEIVAPAPRDYALRDDSVFAAAWQYLDPHQ